MLHVHGAGGNESVDAALLRGFQRLSRAVDVLEARARQPAHNRRFDLLRNRIDRFEITIGRDRETRLDNVHAHFIEQRGDFDFLFMRHGRARRLLAVAQRRV